MHYLDLVRDCIDIFSLEKLPPNDVQTDNTVYGVDDSDDDDSDYITAGEIDANHRDIILSTFNYARDDQIFHKNHLKVSKPIEEKKKTEKKKTEKKNKKKNETETDKTEATSPGLQNATTTDLAEDQDL